MSSKRPNLAAVVEAAGSTRRAVPPPEPRPPETRPAEEGERRRRAPSREDTKMVGAHFPPDVAWQFRELAVQRRTTVQDLLAEALNDIFAKYGRPEIAPRTQDGRN